MTQEEREARALTAIIDSFDRHIWEGWTVWDFIEALRPELDLIMTGRSIYKPFTSKKALSKWCADQQPYYKEEVPEVATYFAVLYGVKR